MKRRKHDLGEWLMAVRPWSFPASAMPVVVTLAYLFACHETVNWLNGAWALLNIVLFHAASNIWSDYFDYKHKVDTEESFGVKILTSGQFAPKEIFRGALLLLGVACLAGAGLWLRRGDAPLYRLGKRGLHDGRGREYRFGFRQNLLFRQKVIFCATGRHYSPDGRKKRSAENSLRQNAVKHLLFTADYNIIIMLCYAGS